VAETIPRVKLIVSAPDPALIRPFSASVDALKLMESFPSPPLTVMELADTATKVMVSLPAPPPTKPLFVSLDAEKATESLPALPTVLKEVAEEAETTAKTVSLPDHL
jgi:hypothetical protein